LVLMFPEGAVHQHRQLELALLLYCFCLFFSIRLFPSFARRYITLASLGRKFLGNTIRISWAFPVFLLWSMGQLSTYVVQRVLGEDIALNIAFEKHMFESLISAGSTPDTSFLNLLTALAVMPMAAFTTLAVLGGGAGAPPSWMQPKSNLRTGDDTQEQINALAAGIDHLAAELNQAKQTFAPQHTPAMVQHVVVPVAVQAPQPPASGGSVEERDTVSLVDGLDFERISAPRPEPEGQQKVTPDFDQPVIRGFNLEDTD